jgi:tetratricopeptide (TPR) repeat protein
MKTGGLWLLGGALLASALVFAGCQTFLSARDGDIRHATHALDRARDDAQRARAYSSRGTAYSEKARYSRIMKLIPHEEYERLFNLAMKDHNQAVALSPADAAVYLNRAQAYYDRGSLDLVEGGGSKALANNPWFDQAALDFEKAAQTDPRNYLALDLLGLTYEQNSQPDKAIEAYTREMALHRRLGKMRLADAYCNIGFGHEQRREFADAAAAYRKSIEFGVADDKSCPVEPWAEIAGMARGGHQ